MKNQGRNASSTASARVGAPVICEAGEIAVPGPGANRGQHDRGDGGVSPHADGDSSAAPARKSPHPSAMPVATISGTISGVRHAGIPFASRRIMAWLKRNNETEQRRARSSATGFRARSQARRAGRSRPRSRPRAPSTSAAAAAARTMNRHGRPILSSTRNRPSATSAERQPARAERRLRVPQARDRREQRTGRFRRRRR